MPCLLALRNGKRPVKKIAHVRQDVGWSTAFFSGAERGKAFWRIAQRLSRAVGQRCQGMPQKLPAVIIYRLRCCRHGRSLKIGI